MIIANSVSELRKKLRNEKGVVMVLGGNESVNRAAFSDKKVDILVSPERSVVKDYMMMRTVHGFYVINTII